MTIQADLIEIVPFNQEVRASTLALIDTVFPDQSIAEKWALRLHQRSGAPLLPLLGVLDPRFWIAQRGDQVLGTVGLYSTWRDRAQARWLAWFCVAPEARGQGLGPRLLTHAKEHCRAEGFGILRLYTSTDPNEATAQKLYDTAGFRRIASRRPLLWALAGSKLELLYREASLVDDSLRFATGR